MLTHAAVLDRRLNALGLPVISVRFNGHDKDPKAEAFLDPAASQQQRQQAAALLQNYPFSQEEIAAEEAATRSERDQREIDRLRDLGFVRGGRP